MSRMLPNILIAGTPATGKTTLLKMLITCDEWEEEGLSERFEAIHVGEFAQDNNCYDGYDEDYDCFILNEKKLLNLLRPRLEIGGVILDYHSGSLFSADLIDIVYVTRTDTDRLYDRLVARGYSDKKRQENMDCEIFQTILDEAQSTYEDVQQLSMNTDSDIVTNCIEIQDWIKEWLECSTPPPMILDSSHDGCGDTTKTTDYSNDSSSEWEDEDE